MPSLRLLWLSSCIKIFKGMLSLLYMVLFLTVYSQDQLANCGIEHPAVLSWLFHFNMFAAVLICLPGSFKTLCWAPIYLSV